MPPLRCDDALTRGAPLAVAQRSFVEPHAPRRAHAVHEYATLGFYVDGGCRMEQRAEWNVAPGDVVIIPAGEPHRMLEARKPTFWGLGFCVPCFAGDDTAPLLALFDRVRGGASAVVHIPGERQAQLEGLFRELASASARIDAVSAVVQRSLLTLILDEVNRAAAPEPAQLSGNVVAESLRVIERRCLGPLTLADVAAAVDRSPAYVTTALRKATGRSAVEWIIAGRMAEARRRLLHSDEPVDVIAERVGYADPTHFIRMFRRHHAATPAAWRAAQRAAT